MGHYPSVLSRVYAQELYFLEEDKVMSKGEEKIITLLQKGKYRFEREKRFSDLKKGLYRFDFYVLRAGRPVLIELNGAQHYEHVKKFHPTRAEFEGAKERDRRKISYALAKGIPLYIIPFWELENLNKSADLFRREYLALNRWKNDLDWQRYQNLTKRQKI